jgi:hypothetical protein
MADYPSLDIKSPDVGATMGTIFGLQSKKLQLQQQAQDLQTGAYQQQSAQGAAQQAQQAMGERQLLQKTMATGVDDQGKSILNDQNEVDPAKMTAFATRALPLTGQQVVQNITKTMSDKTALASSVADLADKSRDETSGILRSFVNNPQAKAGDVKSALTDYAKQNPAASNAVLSAMPLIDKMDQAGSMKDKNAALIHLAQQFQPAATTAGQQAPTISTVQAPGPVSAVQPVQMNPNAPGGIGATGAPIKQGLAPTEQLPYRADAASTTARAAGTAGSDIDRANEVSAMQQQSAAAIPLTQRIDQLSSDIASGKVAKMVSETGNYFGLSSINEARSQLNKDLGQVKGLAIQRSGSDSRAATVLEGYPTDTTPENTTHAAMDYIRGTARQNLARGQLLSQYQQSDPQGLRGFQAADNILSRQTDPLMHEYQALKPEDQAGFYRRNFATPQQAQDFKNQVNALKKHTSVLGQ